MNAAELYLSFMTILQREIRRFLRIWPQTLLPPTITTGLYFIIFGSLIGSRIGSMGGVEYIQFVVPGLIMMAVITSAYGNVVSSFFGSKFQHNIEELLVSPTPNWVIVVGYVAGGVARGLCIGAIVTALSLFFTSLQIQHVGVTVAIVLLTSILFALAGLINAIYAKNFDDISIVPTFVLTPLTYLGGVFYSIELLPVFWQYVSKANPILYMVNAFRYGVLGTSDFQINAAVGLICVFIVLAFMFSLHLLNKSGGLRN